MRLLPGSCLAFVLALLLVGTTPMGTGAGTHQFDLIHPLFAHVHIVNGQILTHDQVQQAGAIGATRTSPGPAFGAGSAANPGPLGLGISPIVPTHALGPLLGPILPRLTNTLRVPASRLRESPPDPPPTPGA
jgi:hypothetical protein